MRQARAPRKVMDRARKTNGRKRDWWAAGIAGLLGFALTAGAIGVFGDGDVSLSALSVALAMVAGALAGMLAVGTVVTARARRKLSEHTTRLDAAIDNMNQGLCMFDAQSRLVLWNERYRAMYNIDPLRIWRGCTVPDLLNARIAAGTFPLEPDRYEVQLRAHLNEGKAFTLTIELADGRTVDVVNQPIRDGGWVATHEDVTDRKRAERDLERTRSFLNTIIENVPCPIIVKDIPSLRYSLLNRAAEQYLGIDRAAMLGRTSAAIMPEASARSIEAEDRKLIERGEAVFIDEHSMVTPANGTRIVSATRLPVFTAAGRAEHLITVINDVTDKRRSEQRLAHMAHHDSMTDLPNRAAFNACLSRTLDIASASGDSFAVLCIDLDRFTEVNDVFGHPAGDMLLREVALRMQEACDGAFLARIGGDEFGLITPTGSQPEGAEALAEKLCASLADEIEVVAGNPLRVGLTVGVAIFPQDGSDSTALMANADAALFRAKAEARGSIRFFEMSMDRQLREKRALQQDLRTAIARGEIELHYQPQAQIGGGTIGFEALVRWHHPREGLVPPSTFIPIAEESGLIGPLGEWILRTACREAASWPRPLGIAVNLSPAQFEHGDLPQLVHGILLETGLAPSRLELEITEGMLIGDFNRAVGVLRRLKGLGVRIAMDDFGTGYSSLSYLQSFPFDKLKIDRAFVSNLGRSAQAATIIRAVIALGRGLDLPVIAEGVETDEQLKFLAAAGCNEVQGYLIGRPKTIADYAEMVGRPGQKPRLVAVS
ncbi:MAG: putative bifunctional diguanylate cyclase/phosphodiesterase [Pseudolabrys sp.]